MCHLTIVKKSCAGLMFHSSIQGPHLLGDFRTSGAIQAAEGNREVSVHTPQFIALSRQWCWWVEQSRQCWWPSNYIIYHTDLTQISKRKPCQQHPAVLTDNFKVFVYIWNYSSEEAKCLPYVICSSVSFWWSRALHFLTLFQWRKQPPGLPWWSSSYDSTLPMPGCRFCPWPGNKVPYAVKCGQKIKRSSLVSPPINAIYSGFLLTNSTLCRPGFFLYLAYYPYYSLLTVFLLILGLGSESIRHQMQSFTQHGGKTLKKFKK